MTDRPLSRSTGTRTIPATLRRALLGAALAAAALSILPAASRAASETVRFQNGDVGFSASLDLPDGPAPYPAIVLLTGSDPSPRDAPFFEDLRRRFAERGFAALSFDKRGVGDSDGTYEETPDFDVAAGDGLAAVRYLLGRPDIDSTRVGVWGVSQGGWLALLMAAKSPEVAFVINISGPGVSPFEQTMFQRGVDLSEREIPPRQVAEAIDVRRRILTYFATGKGAEDARAAFRGLHARPWFRAASETDRWFEALANLKSLPPPSALPPDIVATLKRTYEYDPAAVAARVRVPVLNVFGGKDRHIPVEPSVAALKAAFRRGGNRDATFRVIPEGGHAIQVVEGKAECLRCMAERRREGTLIELPVPGYYDLILGWAEDRFGPPTARLRHG